MFKNGLINCWSYIWIRILDLVQGNGMKIIRRNAFHCIYFDAIYRKIVDTLFLHRMFLC